MTLFWMCSKLDRLLDIDREQLPAQSERRRKYAKGRLMNSRTGTWKLFPRAVRTICQTDPSERIHESVWQRVTKDGGQPLPSPYRNEQFLPWLEQHRERQEPLSAYELDLLGDLSDTAPEKTLPRSHRVTSFCDRIVEWLGGSQ